MIIDNHTVPNGVPTRLQATIISSVSLFLSWHAPDAEYTNSGILRQYHVEVTDNSSMTQVSYTADETHLLLNGLQTNHEYTFRVAALTNVIGSFSQPVTITLQGTFTSSIIT